MARCQRRHEVFSSFQPSPAAQQPSSSAASPGAGAIPSEPISGHDRRTLDQSWGSYRQPSKSSFLPPSFCALRFSAVSGSSRARIPPKEKGQRQGQVAHGLDSRPILEKAGNACDAFDSDFIPNLDRRSHVTDAIAAAAAAAVAAATTVHHPVTLLLLPTYTLLLFRLLLSWLRD
jgi:hypothetical protein